MNAYRMPPCFLMAAPPFQRMLSRQALALITSVAWALADCRDSGPTGPSTGWVWIATTTTGGNLDPDGYAVTVDRGTAQAIADNATLTIAQISAGNHQLTLTGVASNCAVGGLNPRTVTVAAGDTTATDFAVRCGQSGPMLPQTVYIWTLGSSSQNVMMASLAGIVNRNTHGELLLSPLVNRSLPNPVFWLDQLVAAHPEVGSQSESDPSFFIARYRSMLVGYVLYDRAVNAHSINMATSIAGVTDAIVVDPATLSYATAAGLSLIADTRTMTYSQVYAQYGSQFNRAMLFHHGTTFDETLRDYAVMNKGFVIYTNPTALNPYAASQDGDNVSSLTGAFATDPKWFGSAYRGNFDMTWDLTSTLAEVNPVAFNYYYQHASNGTHKDNFVSAGGSGTIFPSQYPDNAGLVASISQSMKLADQKVVSILDGSYDTGTLYPILDDPQIMGMMFKTYDGAYKGRDGALDWHNGKPILSVKYSLWDGVQSARDIADALNASTHRDAAHDSESYSIVNVHPWSTLGPTGTGAGDPMSNLNQLVNWLDPTGVKVVTLEELMVHLRKNFGTPPYQDALVTRNMERRGREPTTWPPSWALGRL